MKRSLPIIAVLLFALALPVSAGLSPDVAALSKEWARIKYQLPKKERKKAFEALASRANAVSAAHQGEANPLIWEAIIVSSAAGEQGGVGFAALSMVKKAKKLLDQAEQIDSDALDGSVYTSLGSLYYKVPGWPVGFGDDDKARSYLEKALSVNPDGIDPNYFYGDFLMSQKDYQGAIKAFERALAAPARPNQPIADAGRRGEIETALAEARNTLLDKGVVEPNAYTFGGR
jgi:tetratricopeptide (TPR) repeat protein